jgi:elongation factor P--beta-lysine ligase
MSDGDAEEAVSELTANPEHLIIQLPSWGLYEDWQRSKQLVGHSIRQPIQSYDDRMKRLEKSNPEKFKVERRSQFASVLDAWLDPQKVDAMFLPWEGRELKLTERGILRHRYYMHCDPALNNDNFALAIGHAETAPPDEHGEVWPHVVIDFMKVWKPTDYEDGKIDYSDDFFGKQTSLTVSGQLEGELGATALGAIYTFGPTFRAENSNTPRHLAEFWMVEPEVAFLDLAGLMDLEEDFIKYCIRWALTNCKDDIEFLNKMIDKSLIARLEGVLNSEFVRLPYTEGIRILQEAIQNGKKFEFPCEWGDDLASEHERYLVEEHFKKPVIMTNYPKAIKAFYMKIDAEESGFGGKSGQTVQGTDVLFPQIGEIIGGSVREESYDKLMNEIEERNIPMKDMTWYLDTRKYGSCPHAGFGLGFERLILFVTGMQNIRDVIPFPRTPKSAEF